MQVGRAIQQQQPDLVITLQAQYDHVRRSRPVRYAFCPDGRHHPAVLHNHHCCLLDDTNKHDILTFLTAVKNCSYFFLKMVGLPT